MGLAAFQPRSAFDDRPGPSRAPWPLFPRRRVAFTSCCRGIWVREDVAGSPDLWGKLELGSGRLRTHRKAAGLAAWLARHRAALRQLSISSYTDRAQLAKALHGLVAGPATAGPGGRAPATCARLQLHTLDLSSHLDREGFREVLEPLRSLTGLRRLPLRECRLAIVPPQLSVLRQLEELDFSGNTLRDPLADNICGPLAQLVSLTRLQLSRCALSALPPQLRSLKQLAERQPAARRGGVHRVGSSGGTASPQVAGPAQVRAGGEGWLGLWQRWGRWAAAQHLGLWVAAMGCAVFMGCLRKGSLHCAQPHLTPRTTTA